jgi:hypothetical protein
MAWCTAEDGLSKTLTIDPNKMASAGKINPTSQQQKQLATLHGVNKSDKKSWLTT